MILASDREDFIVAIWTEADAKAQCGNEEVQGFMRQIGDWCVEQIGARPKTLGWAGLELAAQAPA